MNKTKYIIGGIFLIAIVGLPLLASLTRQTQDPRSRAAPSTTLYFSPSASASAPLEAQIGDTIALDVWINPGQNLASVIKLDLKFDATKLQASPTSFLTNQLAFPAALESPLLTPGNLKLTISTGSDPTKAISAPTKIGTFTLNVIGSNSNTPTSIFFGNDTSILSIGPTDHANENVLASSQPIFINIPGPTPTTTPTATQSATALAITAFMHGIGSSGDNANPTNSSLSNKAPQHTQRTATAYIYNHLNQLVSTSSGNLNYDPDEGNFKGTITLTNEIPQGVYTIKIQSPVHLRRLVPGIQTLIPNKTNTIPPITLITGDIKSDNALNILDYSILVDCYSDIQPPKSCTETNKLLADINDDGSVNQVDYNLFLREITVQNGD
jgi:hypothetical protein